MSQFGFLLTYRIYLGNSVMTIFLVLFDVSMEISPRQFHLGKIGHALSKVSISWVKAIYLGVK